MSSPDLGFGVSSIQITNPASGQPGTIQVGTTSSDAITIDGVSVAITGATTISDGISTWAFITKSSTNPFIDTGHSNLKFISSGTATLQSRTASDAAYGEMGAAAFNVSSSRDTKDEIETWSESALPHVLGTRMTKYRRIVDHKDGAPVLSDRHSFGPILEEMPEFLKAEHETYNLGSTVGLLWKAIQELDTKKQDKGQ